MAVLNGTLYVFSVDGNAIGSTKNATLTLNMDTPEATTKDSGGYRELIAGLRSWSGSFDGLYDPTDANGVNDITSLWTSRSSFTVLFRETGSTSGTESYTGTAFFTSFEKSAPREDVMTFSASFEGTGTLTITQIT